MHFPPLVESDTPSICGTLYFMEFNIISPKFGIFIASIDDEDYDVVSKYNWVIEIRRGDRQYAIASIKVGVNKFKHIYLHRLIMGFPKGLVVDHIDHNGLNNRKNNLRIATHRNNSSNQKVNKANTSGYKGVHYYKGYKKYSVTIMANGKQIFGGYFLDKTDAAKKYNELAIEYHGEFAYLNKIPNE